MRQNFEVIGTVVALAGRRVDTPNAQPPRFPLENVPVVRMRLAELFSGEGAVALVCSAAGGADFVAIEEAERLGLRTRIVLPFAAERFRRTSVIDRPGEWELAFDRLVAAADAAGDLVVLDADGGNAAYATANEAIVWEAQFLSRAHGVEHRLVAVVAWEGAARSGSDATHDFRELATQAGFEQIYVPTL